jgi:hypothetical protein
MTNLKHSFLSFFSIVVLLFLSTAVSFAQTPVTRIQLPQAVVGKFDPSHKASPFTSQSALTVYDHGDPTAEEQYELELINRARANPTAEGLLLYNTTDPYLVQNRSFWGSPTKDQVKSDFSHYAAQQPLAFNKDIIAAARIHSQDMLDHNYQEHTSPIDNSDPFSRMQAQGYTGYDVAGENIFAYGNDLDEINQEFEYDFGNPGLGHRENLINFGNYVYSEIGIGIIHGFGSGGIMTNGQNDGPIITTEDFGHIQGNVFITGVVYGDDNSNQFYDVGEGISGATITVSGSSNSAVSSTSGGYAIPFTQGQGAVTVTATGGLLTAPISHTIELGDVNVKVDFVQGGTGLPDKVVLVNPPASTLADSTTVHFSWAAVSGATQYEIQIATKPAFSTPLIKDATVSSGVVYTMVGLKDTTTYYWHVRAKNVNGWGTYSTTYSFKVQLPGAALTQLTPKNGANVGANTDVMLTWQPTNPPANLYWVVVSSSKTLADSIINDNSSGNPGYVISAIDYLQNGKTYYWNVRGQTDKGWTAPSQIWSFVTGSESVAGGENNFFHSSVSPNPAIGSAHIKFTLDNSYPVTLKIYDVSGKEESTLNGGIAAAGEHEIIWNANGKPDGVYIYRLTAGEKSETGRIVLLK